MDSYDPFDIWSLPRLGRLKTSWYAGSRLTLFPLAATYSLDLLAPVTLRRILRTPKYEFPHVLAMLQTTHLRMTDPEFVTRMEATQRDGGWGLPFPWYSVNGVYPAGTPYMTNTPYVMSALTRIPGESGEGDRAKRLFWRTWAFLESLPTRVDDGERLAVSYAPREEPFTVVNANSYAALAYALHAVHGEPGRHREAEDRAGRIIRWILDQQNDDGSWFYLAERGPWDMIDGFHTCFVIKNLRRATRLLGAAPPRAQSALDRAWDFVRTRLFDVRAGLCRRYALRHRRDPFKYDLYDQAEFLGLLIDHEEFDEARVFAERVERRFKRGGAWYCRVDATGRLWGRGFLRWGIAPFLHHRARLDPLPSIRETN